VCRGLQKRSLPLESAFMTTSAAHHSIHDLATTWAKAQITFCGSIVLWLMDVDEGWMVVKEKISRQKERERRRKGKVSDGNRMAQHRNIYKSKGS
jgi:hypothetical protein